VEINVRFQLRIKRGKVLLLMLFFKEEMRGLCIRNLKHIIRLYEMIAALFPSETPAVVFTVFSDSNMGPGSTEIVFDRMRGMSSGKNLGVGLRPFFDSKIVADL
jgi:hypothetical protein